MEFYTWDAMEKEVLSETIGRKIISGEKAMVAQVFLAKGAIVPRVSANWSGGTWASGGKNGPNAFWHMRQWQISGADGRSCSA